MMRWRHSQSSDNRHRKLQRGVNPPQRKPRSCDPDGYPNRRYGLLWRGMDLSRASVAFNRALPPERPSSRVTGYTSWRPEGLPEPLGFGPKDTASEADSVTKLK